MVLDEGLRQRVSDSFAEMHQYFQRRFTPKVKRTKACNACSLKNLCLPQLMKDRSVKEYISRRIGEEEEN